MVRNSCPFSNNGWLLLLTLSAIQFPNHQDKKPAKKVTWRNMYQHVFKVDPLACLLCGKKLLFAGMNFGLNRKELMARHHDLACLRWR